MSNFKCKSCGSEFDVSNDAQVFKCSYCGVTSLLDVDHLNIKQKSVGVNLNSQYEFQVKLKNAKYYMNKTKEYYEAYNLFLELFIMDQTNIEVLEGLMICITHNFERHNVVGFSLNEDNDFHTYFKLYEKYVKDKKKAINFLNKYRFFKRELKNPRWLNGPRNKMDIY